MRRGVLGVRAGARDWGVLFEINDGLLNDSTLWRRRTAKTLTAERANV